MVEQGGNTLSSSVGGKLRYKIFGRYYIGLNGILFVAPVVCIIAFFLAWPIAEAFYYSFFQWDGVTASFVGISNYIQLFNSPVFGQIVVNNLVILATVPIWVLLPLCVAILLFNEIKGWKLFRFLLFAPTALSWAIIGVVWQFVFSYHGPFNRLISLFHVQGPDWLSNGPTALAIIILAAIWANVGSGLIIYLAGLAAIGSEVLEAARIDGANGWTMFWHILFPLMKKYIQFLMVLSVITAFTGMFSLIYSMTSGGPGFSTTTMEYFTYTDAFLDQNFGQASAVGVVLFIIVFLISLLQMRLFSDSE